MLDSGELSRGLTIVHDLGGDGFRQSEHAEFTLNAVINVKNSGVVALIVVFKV